MSEDLGFVHHFVAATSPHAPTLLLLHGTGGGENDLLGVGRSIAPDAALLSPRGNSLEEGFPRFFRRFAEGQFDEADVIRRASELANFVSAAADHYLFDPARVVALGYSNGANIAAAVMLQRPSALRGAMLLRAMVPLETHAAANLAGKAILMCSASNDRIVPAENTRRLAKRFEDAGAAVTLKWFDTGHALSQDDLAACAQWYAQFK